MSNITNSPDNADEFITIYRSQLEHRATWMGLIYDEMVKAGIDAETIIRRAITDHLADLVLLDRDIFTIPKKEIRDTKVLWSMVGGNIAYRKK